MRRANKENWFLIAVRYGPTVAEVIAHSGGTFRAIGEAEGRRVIWPVEEWIARHPVTPRMRRKLQSLNPLGQPEGMHPRGYRPKLTVRDIECRSDCVSLGHFAAFMGLTRREVEAKAKAQGIKLIKHGRRKFLSGIAAVELERPDA